MHYPSRRVAALLALSAVAAACSSSKGTAPAPTGSMTVTVTSANGGAASVVISGPNGYTKTITSTQTITGLALGNYVIAADTTVTPDSVVGSIIDTGAVTGSPATVAANATASVSVNYAMKYRLGGMWVANNDNGYLPDLSANQLRAGGTIAAAETLQTVVTSGGPAGLAIDANGTMWESLYDNRTLEGWTPADRNGHAAAPTFSITSSSLSDPECIAFDAHGNLWVADNDAGLVEFTPSQLAASGTPTATVVIAPGSVMNEAEGIAFDANGNAWVADRGAQHILEFSAAQLASSATTNPADTINTASTPEDVAFDANGNLWVVTEGPSALEYTPAQLAAGGAPNPTVTVTLPGGTDPFGMAFDHRGTLWVSDYNGFMLGLTAAQLAATGSPTPAITDTISVSNGFQPEQPVFDPYAAAIGAVGAARVRPYVVSAGHVRQVNPNRPNFVAKP
jgi:sugar lactone lactonase YvrE